MTSAPGAATLPSSVLARLACPRCRQPLAPANDGPVEALVCSFCGQRYPVAHGIPLLFPEEPPDEWAASQKALYDGVAPHYDDAIPTHVAEHYRRKRVALVRSLAPPSAAVLDVGCGTGTLCAAIRAAGYDVTGLDASTGMLAQLAQHKRGAPVAGFSERLPFLEGTFDLAITVATLHHISDPGRIAATIGEMCRVTRPGGAIVVWDHNPNNPYWPYLMKRIPQDTGEERLVPLDEIQADFHSAGVADVSAMRSGLMPDFTPQALVPLVGILEAVVERTPGMNVLCAHNVVVGRKST